MSQSELPPASPPFDEPYAPPRESQQYYPPPRRRRVLRPLVLFVLTCLSVYYVGGGGPSADAWKYAVALMTILICHEAGHFLQALRYRVYASFPYFIPMPLPPIGTLGAVIAMDARAGDRKALFDIGITGPLAGLVPTLLFTILGLQQSKVVALPPVMPPGTMVFGDSILFRFLVEWTRGQIPPGFDVMLHPWAMAGWVGLLITSLNLMPIGQLDGGHILYGLLRRKAHTVAWVMVVAAAASIAVGAVVFHRYELLGWVLMLTFVVALGPRHPPTANDDVPLGIVRTVLGWLCLAFVPLAFTPIPMPWQ